jgi:hypothetical protein
VVFEANEKTRNFMHVVDGSTGSELGAGLFTKTFQKEELK